MEAIPNRFKFTTIKSKFNKSGTRHLSYSDSHIIMSYGKILGYSLEDRVNVLYSAIDKEYITKFKTHFEFEGYNERNIFNSFNNYAFSNTQMSKDAFNFRYNDRLVQKSSMRPDYSKFIGCESTETMSKKNKAKAMKYLHKYPDDFSYNLMLRNHENLASHPINMYSSDLLNYYFGAPGTLSTVTKTSRIILDKISDPKLIQSFKDCPFSNLINDNTELETTMVVYNFDQYTGRQRNQSSVSHFHTETDDAKTTRLKRHGSSGASVIQDLYTTKCMHHCDIIMMRLVLVQLGKYSRSIKKHIQMLQRTDQYILESLISKLIIIRGGVQNDIRIYNNKVNDYYTDYNENILKGQVGELYADD